MAQDHDKTIQGIYAVTPSGRLIGPSVPSPLYPHGVPKMMEGALEKWKKMGRKERLLPEAPPKGPAGRLRGDLYPEGGLVLQVFTRDLPRGEGETDVTPKPPFRCKKGSKIGAGNQDWAWFTKEEVGSMIPATKSPGTRHPIPDKLARRIAKFHLVDNVLGQMRSFKDDEVKKADLAIVVTRVEGDALHLRLEGSTKTERHKDGKPIRGYDARLLGRASYD